jgi:hypothetical protein
MAPIDRAVDARPCWRSSQTGDVMWRVGVTLALGFICCAPHVAVAVAQDATRARDHPLIKRFPNSTIVRYERHSSARYTVPTGPLIKWDYARGQPEFGGKNIDLEGEVTRITYVVRRGIFAAEVFRTYKNELIAKRFRILYEAEGIEFGQSQGNLYRDLGGQLLEYSPKGAHFLSAKLDTPAATYVTLYVTEYEWAPLRPKSGRGRSCCSST